MQRNPRYGDVVAEVRDYLAARIAACEMVGIARSRIAIDPGIGFGKTLAHNLSLLQDRSATGARLSDTDRARAELHRPCGGSAPAKQRLGGSLAALAPSAWRACVGRTTAETVQALKIWTAIGTARG
jgi:dihydropteroate synthase